MSATLEIVRAQMQALEAEVARLRELAEHRGKSLVKQLDATLAETRAHEATKAERDKYSAEIDALAHRVEIQRLETEAAEARIKELESYSEPIQRYGHRPWKSVVESGVSFERKQDGQYVRFDDHCRAMTASYAKRRAAEARVTELERDIGAINNEWHAETMRKLKAEAALDQARALLEREGTVMRDDPDHVEARQVWLRAHPATPEREHPEAHAIRQQIVDESLRVLGLHMPVAPEPDMDDMGPCLGCKQRPCVCATPAARGERFLQRVEQAGPLEVTVLASCVPPATPAATGAEWCHDAVPARQRDRRKADAEERQVQPMTRAEYNERAREICSLVNFRRAQLGKEPLQAQRIMRAVRLAIGPAPESRYPAKHPHRVKTRNAPIPYALTDRARLYFERRSGSG